MAKSFIQGVWLNLTPYDLSPGPSGTDWLNALSPCPSLLSVCLCVFTPEVPCPVLEYQKDPRTRVPERLGSSLTSS